MTHPVLAAAHLIDGALDSVADVNPTFMQATDKAVALRDLARLEARVAELRLRLLADADDVALESGAKDAADWWAHATRNRPDVARADLALAEALERRHGVLAAALRGGRANLAQAHAIARSLDALPDDLGDDLRGKAEQVLVDHADDFGPRQLARLGGRILDVVAPEIAEEVEGRRLATLEAAAAGRVRLSLRRLGDGTTRLSGLLPDAVATRLATYLEAFTSPRKAGAQPEGPSAADPLTRLAHPRKLGEAFCQLLEAFDPDRLPLHGGNATTVMVTISLDSLRRDLGRGELLGASAVPGEPATHDGLSAGEVRRLACTAHVIPVVLGGKSEILDLGRSRRLFSRAQQRALLLRDRTCRAEGCDIPGTWAEAHHWNPWSQGGRTDLADGVLLCSRHHHRIHEAGWRGERLPSGDVRFHRRR